MAERKKNNYVEVAVDAHKLMEQLKSDPIIAVYIQMSKHTEYETVLPMYSEMTLRLAFKTMLKVGRFPTTYELRLYRDLLLLYYAETYKTEDDLQLIMRKFYTNTMVRQICAQRDTIMQEWRNYWRGSWTTFLYKDTLFKILSEWKHRYESLYGKVNIEQLRCKVGELQKILGFNAKFMVAYLKTFQTLLLNPNFKWTSQKLKSVITHDDLSIENIYEDIKSSLLYVVRESFNKKPNVDSFEQQEPPVKRKKVTRTAKATKKLAPDFAGTKIADRQVEDTATTSQQKVSVFYEYEVDASAKSDENTSTSECLAKSNDFVTVTTVVTDSESDNDATKDTIDSDDSKRSAIKPNTEAQENKSTYKIIDYDTTMHYIAALQAYALMNDSNEALDLLDKVDTIFRTKPH